MKMKKRKNKYVDGINNYKYFIICGRIDWMYVLKTCINRSGNVDVLNMGVNIIIMMCVYQIDTDSTYKIWCSKESNYEFINGIWKLKTDTESIIDYENVNPYVSLHCYLNENYKSKFRKHFVGIDGKCVINF
jgi:hypothetical protein